jgi:hypothetical protein
MRYIFRLLSCEVKFSHAGQGTSFSRRDPGEAFSRVDTSVLGEKNIFMHRNPLDVAVSMFFQIHKHDPVSCKGRSIFKYLWLAWNKKLPPKDMNMFVLHPVWGVENICRYNRAWLDYFEQHPSNLVISYEEAKQDLAGVVKKFIEFANLPSADVDEIVRQSDFESMKKIELKGKSWELRLYGQRKGDPDTMKVRKGVVQGYRDYLSLETIAEAEKIASQFNFNI